MLVLGVGIGWVATKSMSRENSKLEPQMAAKPTPAEKPSWEQPEKPAARNGNSAAIQERRNEREKNEAAAEDAMRDAKAAGSKFGEKIVQERRMKAERHFYKLVEEIELTAHQKSSLQEWLEEKLQALESIEFTNPDQVKSLENVSVALSEKGIEDHLTASLDEKQKEDLMRFREKDLAAHADTAALKNYTKLQSVVDIDPEQRDEVMQALREASLKREQEKLARPASAVTDLITDSLGVDMDPYDLGLQDGMMESIGSPEAGAGTAPPDLAAQIRATFAKRVEEKIAVLRPVLDEKQLQQYRDELQSKGLGVYSMTLEALETNARDGGP